MAKTLFDSLSWTNRQGGLSRRSSRCRLRGKARQCGRVQSNLFFGEDSFQQHPEQHEIHIPRRPRVLEPLPSLEEQRLCVGASFTIAATNGVDPTRRLHLLGFCRSVQNLSEVVEDAVLQRGGQVMLHHIEIRSGLHEILKMTVAIPLLYGVPPQHEYLRSAISSGGGIVEKTLRQWQIY